LHSSLSATTVSFKITTTILTIFLYFRQQITSAINRALLNNATLIQFPSSLTRHNLLTIYLSMALQTSVGPCPLFQFLNPTHNR
jgi:hypothetical protein